jgi:gliding motility-associated-like protein
MINTIPLNIYKSLYRLIFLALLFAGSKGFGQCPGLNASFVPSKTEICTPSLTTNHTVTFINTSTGANATASSYEWYLENTPIGLFANSTNLTAPAPLTFNSDGYGNYLLVGYNPVNNCYDTAPRILLTVTLPPNPNFTIDKNNQCAGLPITFSNSSTNVYPTTKYLWSFGDGGASSQASPTHNYAAPGSYNVKLEMINNSNCIDSVIKVVTVIKAPVPAFTFTNDNQCAGTTLAFTNETTDTIPGTTIYDWDFGDGTTHATTTDATHVYASANTYTVTLTVTNGPNCKITTTNVVTVTSSPSATFTVTGNNQCLGTTITFNNTSTGITGTSSYQWDFGDNLGTAIDKNPTYVYTAAGTYPVKLTVNNGGACSSTSLITNVVVKNTPVATFTFNNPLCTSTSVSFTNTSTTNGTAGTYLWNFGDGTSMTENPTHPYSANGTYNVTLTITDAVTLCSNTSAVTTITVGSLPPSINFSVTPLTGCSPQTVTFVNSSTGEDPVNNFNWDFGNGNTLSGVKNPSAQTYYQGTYTIRLISGNICGIDTAYKTITIDTVPQIILTTNTTKSCLPINFIATNNSTGGHLSYQWFVNGTLKDISPILPPQLFTTASNTVQLKITNNCGTKDTTVTITESPKVQTVISPLNTTVCSAKDFQFTYSQTSTGDSLSYFWDFDNTNTSVLPNPPIQTFINPGVYHPILIVTGKCGTDTSFATLKVNPVPLTPTVADTTICKGGSVTLIATAPGEKYEWFDAPNGTLLKVGASFKTPVLTADKTYYVKSTIFDCVSPIKAVTVKIKPLPLPPTVTYTTICAGDSAVITATGQGGELFQWFSYVSGGTIVDSVPVFTTPPLTTTTNYFVQAILNGCTSTPRIKATVKVNPLPDEPTVVPVGICSGSTATLTATAPGGTYAWYTAMTGGTLLTTGATYTTPVLTADTAFYVESSLLGCAGPRKRVPVTVTPGPIIDIAADMPNVCVGTEVNFINNSTTGGIYNWSFSGGTPATSTLYTPPPVKFIAGQQLVYLTVNMSGCIRRDSVYVNVEAYPKAKIMASQNEGCSPVTVLFTNQSSSSASDTHFWDMGNGVTSTLVTPPAQLYTAIGIDKTYNATLLITTPAGCKDSTSVDITVHNNPLAAFKAAVNKACVNEGVVFTSESIGALAWKWDFGDGQVSNATLPTHQYLAPGTYTVKLVVTGGFGCLDSVTHDITIDPNPVSAFTATTNCNSYPTQFTDQSTGATKWEWNFGDATPLDYTASPIHVFPKSGTFDVVLTVTNVFGCIDTSHQKITVLEQPQADFTFNDICARQNVTFVDSTIGNNLLSWDWDFGDGTTSTSQNTTHVYSIAGQYPVTLIVKNTLGCIDTVTQLVKVSTIPTPLFKANVTCLGKVTSFTDLSTDAVAITNWFYDFDDGNNSISKNPNYIYSNPGIYNVSLTVTNINGCDSTFTLPVTVDVVPKANYTTDTICINNPTTFTDISVGNVVKWEWDFGDGAKDSVGPVTSHIYATSGSFLTSLKIYTIGGCTDEKFKMVIVRSDVKAGITVKDSACVNEVIFMKDNSTSVGAVVSTSWDFGDGSPVVFSTNASHAYATAGLFVIKHTVIGVGGCENRVTDTVFISAAPDADYTSANTCIEQESNFTDKSKGSPVSWSWDFNDAGTSNVQNPKHTFLKAGAYNVKLTVQTALGCSDTVTKRIIVYSDPKASFTANVSCWGDSTNFINTSNPMDGMIIKTFWDFDDGTTSTVFNPNHILLTKKDSFNVKLVIVTSHGCIDTVRQVVKTFPIPEFKFTAASNSGCNPFTTSFHDSSTVKGGTIVNWLWNFGDKSLTYKNNPSHTYTIEGKFFVSLTITTSYGCRMTDTLKYPITVYPKPVAGFTALPDEASMYEPIIKFIDESQDATLWDWDLGDHTTSVDQFLTHTYADTGTYVVTQVAINKYGCRDTIRHNVRINGEPTMFIPNAFTPDGNGINDIFIPKMFGVREFNMSIYDRYGNLIFTSVDTEVGWNGKVNGAGETVKDDIYIYKIYIRDLMNNPHTYKGTITVLKKSDKE